jgi:DnaJ-class molecular chaperone
MSTNVECPICDGRGYIIVDASTENESAQDTVDCEECDGTGRVACGD